MFNVKPGQPYNSWEFPEDVRVKGSSGWVPAQYIYKKTSSGWQKVWAANTPPAINSNHEYLATSMNGEFDIDSTIGYHTFWSSNRNMPWSISNNNVTINMNYVPIVAIEETKKIYLNTNSGSTTATLSPNQYTQASTTTDLAPLNRETSSGSEVVKWEFYNYPSGAFSTPTYINAFPTSTTITLSNPCGVTVNDIQFDVKRTYYLYTAYCRLQLIRPMYVEPGQVYSIETNAVSVTDPSYMRFSLGAVTSILASQANYFGENSTAHALGFGSYGQTGTASYSMTIPATHNWITPEITIEVNHKPSQYVAPVPTRNYTFSYLRLKRTA